MSATEELRRLLDERGVEWNKGKLAMLDDEYTHWWATERMEGFVAYECNYPLNTLIVRGVTPEQAIAATLGPCNDSFSCTNDCTNDCTNSERTGTWSDFDMQMAYHMGYDDALARRKPDAEKVVTDD